MIRIDLDASEAAILREILEADISDLRMEIANTDQKDFRDHLKERKELLKSILDRMSEVES